MNKLIAVIAVLVSAQAFAGSHYGSHYGSSRETGSSTSSVHVDGYTRRDGTHVQSHERSRADGNFNNNWSTQGNVNPYTGQPGTKTYDPNGKN